MDEAKDGQQTERCSSNKKTNEVVKSWTWNQDGVIDIQDRIVESYKRPRERFERKFQEYIPEYNICLPRAPAFRVVSAKRAGEISERLYNQRAYRRSRTPATDHSVQMLVSAVSSLHSNNSSSTLEGDQGQRLSVLHSDNTSSTEGGDKDDDDKYNNPDEKDKLKKTKVHPRCRRRMMWTKADVLKEDTNNIETDRLQTITGHTDTTIIQSKELQSRMIHTDTSKTQSINSIDSDKMHTSDNRAMQWNELTESQRTSAQYKMGTNCHSYSNKRFAKLNSDKIEHKQLTNCDAVPKYESLIQAKGGDSGGCVVQSEGSLNHKKTGVVVHGPRNKKVHTKEANINSQQKESLNMKSKGLELDLLRDILGQTFDQIQCEEQISTKKLLHRERKSSGVETMKSCEEVSPRLESPSESASTDNISPSITGNLKPPSQKKTSIQILNRPKNNVRLQLTSNEHINMLIYQLALTSKQCRISPQRLLQTFFSSHNREAEHKINSSNSKMRKAFSEKFVNENSRDVNHRTTKSARVISSTNKETRDKPFPMGRDMILQRHDLA
uniref:Uncharacterized protein n=1 Tax=Biomphalaria glabrata TaxID=6526 RepID=A0A2C9KV01_BIOGL